MQYFISYSHLDRKIAEKIRDKIEHEGHKVWMDNERLSGGDIWRQEIEHAIIDCDGLILVLSKNSDASGEVYKEIETASINKKIIYPLMIEEFKFLELIEFLEERQWVELYKNVNVILDRFVTKTLPRPNDIIKNVSQMAKEHYEKMGYYIRYINDFDVETNLELKDIKKEKIFVAQKDNREFIVIPKYEAKILTIGHLNFIEANLFWDIRFLIWSKQLQNEIKKEFNISKEDFLSGDIDNRKKYHILTNKTRDIYFNYSKWNKNIVLYLYIKEAPQYFKTRFPVTLLPKENYENMREGTKIPHLYLNYSKNAGWYGAMNKALEKIDNEKTYPGFEDIYRELVPRLSYKFSSESQSQYMPAYKMKLAESLCKSLYESCSYEVEEIDIKEISVKGKAAYSNDIANNTSILKLKGSPNQYLKVVYLECKDTKEVEDSLSENGDLYNQARQYRENHDKLFMFIFVYNIEINQVEIYFMDTTKNVEDIEVHRSIDSKKLLSVEVRSILNLAQQCFASCDDY